MQLNKILNFKIYVVIIGFESCYKRHRPFGSWTNISSRRKQVSI